MVYASDKLIIDTPEQIPLEFSLAGVGSRALALMLDTLIMFLVGIVVGIIGALAIAAISSYWPGASNWAFAIFLIFFFLLQWGYFAISEILMKGQTFGKRQLDLRVIKDSGAPITAYEAIGRNLLRAIDSLPFLYGVGILAVMLNKQNKRLGDMVAGTVVVHERPLADLQPAFTQLTSSLTSDSPLSAYNTSRLSVDELQLIEAFLQRRYEMPPQLRIQTAFQIADRVGRTLEIPREGRPDPETLLETLARERRSMGR
ncbi:MAG TPA: RDD family protein [Terriglobales bacterium]|nr:RDD family protein [Terriglobales bacterium]